MNHRLARAGAKLRGRKKAEGGALGGFSIMAADVAARLELGMGVADAAARLAGLALEHAVDAPLDTEYLLARGLGLELNFRAGALSAAFLFIDRREAEGGVFVGRCSLLPDDFFVAPTLERFIESLAARGMTRWPKPYPNAVDMVCDDLRVRWTDRASSLHVLIDDGRRLRPPQA